jgi:hypothetical protein
MRYLAQSWLLTGSMDLTKRSTRKKISYHRMGASLEHLVITTFRTEYVGRQFGTLSSRLYVSKRRPGMGVQVDMVTQNVIKIPGCQVATTFNFFSQMNGRVQHTLRCLNRTEGRGRKAVREILELCLRLPKFSLQVNNRLQSSTVMLDIQ